MSTATKAASPVKKVVRRTVRKTPVKSELDQGRESVTDAYGNLRSAGDHLKTATAAAASDIRNEAGNKMDQGAEIARGVVTTTENYVKTQPLTSAGIAFATGVIISRFLGR